MKKLMLLMTLVLCVVALSGCQSNEPQRYVVAGQATQNVSGVSATAVPSADDITNDEDEYTDFDNGSYDPASEEGGAADGEIIDLTQPEDAATVTVAPTVNSEYAGATPVILDPIDKPTPTPVPALSFTYQVYDATKLHLSFEGPVGWIVDDSQSDIYMLTNPDASMSYGAAITVRAVAVTSQYTTSELKKEINQMLDTIGNGDFSSYSPSNTAERTLMDKAGVYANYKGTLSNGVKIAGRVHATCINKVLYTVHITYPQEYTDTYVDGAYAQLRHTMKITQ